MMRTQKVIVRSLASHVFIKIGHEMVEFFFIEDDLESAHQVAQFNSCARASARSVCGLKKDKSIWILH